MKSYQGAGCKSGRNLEVTVMGTDSIFKGKMDVHHQETKIWRKIMVELFWKGI